MCATIESDGYHSVDDLMRGVLEDIFRLGDRISPGKGEALEIRGTRHELLDSRARLSRSETRGRLFSALGELCWYLSGNDDVEPMAYYLKRYNEFAESGKVYGAYGPRLFAFEGHNQVQGVIERLRTNPHSRRAVVQLFDHRDLIGSHNEVPCTCTLQFFIRYDAVQLVVHMRSNDAYLGLPHDIFAFTLIQELVAATLDCELGKYTHLVGSMHLYDRNEASAREFLEEGWHETTPMPAMPRADPWPAVGELLRVEASLRHGADPMRVVSSDDVYWGDLERVLITFALIKLGRAGDAEVIRESFRSNVYDSFVFDKIDPFR